MPSSVGEDAHSVKRMHTVSVGIGAGGSRVLKVWLVQVSRRDGVDHAQGWPERWM